MTGHNYNFQENLSSQVRFAIAWLGFFTTDESFMSFFSITPGEHYGFRKSPSLGTPVQHIEVIAKAKPGVRKVKLIDGPSAGLSGYVRTGTNRQRSKCVRISGT